MIDECYACVRCFLGGNGLETFAGNNEYIAEGTVGIQNQLDDRIGNIACRRRRSHAFDEVSRGDAEIARVSGDSVLAEIGVGNDARCDHHEPQAEVQPIGLFLAIVGEEDLSALGSGIAARERRPGKRRTA